MSYAFGIDIGGTFTDLVLLEIATGRRISGKELTTPLRPSDAVIRGSRALIEKAQISPKSIMRTVHATTLFTNALIERKGAVTGLITTRGFADSLEIGRERKFELYDVFLEMPKPLVPRDMRLEVTERIGPDGSVETPIDLAEVDARSDQLVALGVKSIAICFLHAYANPTHEQQAAARVAARHPGIPVTTSSEIAPEIREFERLSTTVANAYVKPLAAEYLHELEQGLRELGLEAPLFLMLSSGGLTGIEEARRNPIHLLESGPAAGALSAAFFGKMSGAENVLAFDMGGTTAKLSMVLEGKPGIAYSFEAGRTKRFQPGSGLPIKTSTVELIEIGAGGGSIAHLDDLGLMKVGPESASSLPGPSCYGRGGTHPTVTDANLLIGNLATDSFLGGSFAISPDLAETSMHDLSRQTGLNTTSIAYGVHDIVNESMAAAARVHIAERGKNASKFALVTTGGGGPLHGYNVARKLGISKLICPSGAGVASALGLLIAPARVDRVATIARGLSQIDWAQLEQRYQGLIADAMGVIAQTGLDPASASTQRFADMRYVGQGFELVVPLPATLDSADIAVSVFTAFSAAYREVFLINPPATAVEIVNIRVSVTASIGETPLPDISLEGSAQAAKRAERNVYFGETHGFQMTPVYERMKLPAGISLEGPAVIEEPESTLIVGVGGSLTVEANGNIIVEVGQ